ncbi:MAG: type VI secretion system baseplate subunit TssE, partial [Massilia sp.]
MKGFSPGLFDRLMEGSTRSAPQGAPAAVTRLSIEELKDSVARDLEALLNTRAAIGDDRIRAFPECARSIMTYGLKDFAGLSLSSSDDRAYICACIEKTIGRHEPRLRNVRAALV